MKRFIDLDNFFDTAKAGNCLLMENVLARHYPIDVIF